MDVLYYGFFCLDQFNNFVFNDDSTRVFFPGVNPPHKIHQHRIFYQPQEVAVAILPNGRLVRL